MGNGTLATDFGPTANDRNVYKRTSDLAGAADSSKGILSLWFLPGPGTGVVVPFARTHTGGGFDGLTYFSFFKQMRFVLRAPDASFVVFFSTPTGANSGITVGAWNHLLISWDYTGPSLIRHMYINNVDKIGPIGVEAAGVVRHAGVLNNTFGALVNPPPSSTQPIFNWTGCLSEFYWNPGAFLDFSMDSNRALFVDVSVNPVGLGAAGLAPGLGAPAIYFPDGDGSVNAGTGGAFLLDAFGPGPAPFPCATVPQTGLTPREIIDQVRDEIDAAGIAETDDFLRLRLGFSESFLEDALSKFDEGDFRKTAKGVRKAVKFLELAVEKGFDSVQADEWGVRLCGAIKTIATIEIDAAIARTGDPIKIAEAQDAFADGDLDKLFSEFLEAINNYEKAIKSATVA